MKTNTNRNYAKLVLTILAAWLGTAIAASTLLVFHAGSTYAFHPPVPLGLAVTLPILVLSFGMRHRLASASSFYP